jgi:hypothetical protein
MSRHTAETGFALLAAAFGLVVLAGALQHDTGWGATGPGAGYFPLRIGGLLAALGLVLALRQALTAPRDLLLGRGAAGRVAAMFLPTVLFGLAMPWLGSYLPMALYLFWMARIVGRQSWAVSLALALLAPPACFLLFETWLMVPLAKGPIEEALGLW